MDEIRELVERGKAKAMAAVEAEQAEREAAAREKEEARQAAIEQFLEGARQCLPEAVWPYLKVVPEEFYPGHRDQWVTIQIKGVSLVNVRFLQGEDKVWRLRKSPYRVNLPVRVLTPHKDGVDQAFVYYEDQEFDDLEIALGHAAMGYTRGKVLQAECTREEARHQAEEVEGRGRREEERARLLDVIEGDPVALALVRVFAMAIEERWRIGEELAGCEW